jgi:hypothetical protein
MDRHGHWRGQDAVNVPLTLWGFDSLSIHHRKGTHGN